MSTESRAQGFHRFLIVYPETQVRLAVEQALRRITAGALSIFHADSPAEALEKSRRTEPQVVLLGLDDSPRLALDAARVLRQPHRLILGLYNPVVELGTDADRVRMAARAGVSDFITLPVSDADLAAALEAAAPEAEEPPAAEGRTIAFYSNKGGAGTTTLAANVAVAMALQNADAPGGVVLFDADMQFGAAADILGLHADRNAADLAADLDQAGPLSAYLVRHEESGLFLLASPGDLVRAECISPEDASRMAIALRRHFRHVIIDLPRHLDALTLNLLDVADAICVLTEPTLATVRRTARLLALLGEQGFDGGRLRVALRRLAAADGVLTDAIVAAQLGQPLEWEVPHEPRALEALQRGVALVTERPRSPFATAIGAMSRTLAAARGASVAA